MIVESLQVQLGFFSLASHGKLPTAINNMYCSPGIECTVVPTRLECCPPGSSHTS